MTSTRTKARMSGHDIIVIGASAGGADARPRLIGSLALMKNNKNHNNTPSAVPQLVPVHFVFSDPIVHKVAVAGCFNHRQPEAKTPPTDDGDRWVKETALPPGTAECRLVGDGEAMPDPLAKDYLLNPFATGIRSSKRLHMTPSASPPPAKCH